MQRLKNVTVFEKNIEEQNSNNVVQLFQQLFLHFIQKEKQKDFKKLFEINFCRNRCMSSF